MHVEMTPGAGGLGCRPAEVRLRFHLPPPALRPYVTTLYSMDIDAPPGAPVEDWLHPEWANLRIFDRDGVEAAIGEAAMRPVPRAVLTGPTSRTTRFRARTLRSWGIGLLPLGWARALGLPARRYADRMATVATEPMLARLLPLTRAVFAGPPDPEGERARIEEALAGLLARPALREDEIVRLEQALVDPATGDVAQLAEAMAMTTRTLERLCARVCGFTPQALLRRQRFLRSLGQFMLDPSMRWVDALDSHYHDQAQFVRDFRAIMTMTPSDYAARRHPVLMSAAQARQAVAGQPMQVLHRPAAPGEET